MASEFAGETIGGDFSDFWISFKFE